MSTVVGALWLVACGAAPSRPCPLPTPQGERAAFFERLDALRADATRADLPELPPDAAGRLAPAATFLRVRVSEDALGLREGHALSSRSRAEVERRLERSDPMRLGWLLGGDDVETLVSLDSGARVPAEARMGGERGFLITALHAAVEERLRHGDLPPELGLEVRPATPFRTVAEVVYTVAQAGVERLELVVRAGDHVRAHPLAPPRLDSLVEGMLEGAVAPLGLSLTITADGAVVAGSGGRVAPGCGETSTGPEPTIAAAGGAVDADALRACLRRIKDSFPDEDTITVSADPEIAFEHVVRAAVAAAGMEQELFPHTLLSAGIR